MKRYSEFRSRGRRGSALIASLAMVVVVASLGAGLIHLHSSITRRHLHGVDTKRALYLAEAGLAEAYLAVALGKSGAVAEPAVPSRFSDGVFWVDADDLGGGRVELTSNGLFGSGRFSIQTVLQREVNPIGVLGLHAASDLTVGAGAVIDGYDSLAGDFDSQATVVDGVLTTAEGASVGCNSDLSVLGGVGSMGGGMIVLGGGEPVPLETRIYGDARPGPTGTAAIDPGVTISGSTTPRATAAELPAIEVPGVETTATATLVGSQVLAAGEFGYDTLRLGTDATLEIQGPAVVVVDTLAFGDGSTLVLNTSAGTITLYVTGSVTFGARVTFSSPSRDPRAVGLYFTSTSPVDLRAAGELYGLVYAPQAVLTLARTLRFFGALSADSVLVEEGARLTYDTALVTGGVGLGTVPRVVSWRIAELPNEPIVRRRVDPLLQLGVAGVSPTAPSLSHRETQVRIAYTDATRALQVYLGPVGGFVWSDARRIVQVQWQHYSTGLLMDPVLPPALVERNTSTL